MCVKTKDRYRIKWKVASDSDKNRKKTNLIENFYKGFRVNVA